MATIIKLPMTPTENIHLFALSLVRIARLAMIQAPGDILDREMAIIERRAQRVSLQKDRKRIQHVIEDIVMSDITNRFGSTSCLNCNGHPECPMAYIKQFVGGDSEPVEKPRYLRNAIKDCAAYTPDWGGFSKFVREYPDLVYHVEDNSDMKLDRNRLAKHLTVVLERWAKEAGNYRAKKD